MKFELYNEDCLKVLDRIPDNSIQCIVTSPPYNKAYFNTQKRSNQIWGGFEINYNTYEDNLPIDEYEDWMIKIINKCIDKLTSDGSFFFNHKPIRYNNQIYTPWNFLLKTKAIVYQEIIWDRSNSPNIRSDCLVPTTERIYWLCKNKPISYRDRLDKMYISEVWKMTPRQESEHPAPFPYELPSNCILLTTNAGDTVFDPFTGIGTTGVSAVSLDRKFIGAELDKKYFTIAKNKLEELNQSMFDEEN